ncbi:hypothetical protein F8388_020335 [Cannabis sativa]|uniref:Protein kinase domain-containing protein n=1 Tax=Cannabis sativa TaxID=3483 RepID=A0A7J6HJ82_CANSA|nr:hypothetical protein F8388_020335 [Cannabis sativa]
MEWTRGDMIGRGSTAAVYVAAGVSSGDIFAVKSTELSFSKLLQKEQSFLSNLNSPHLVKYMGFDITNENDCLFYNLFMEYLPRGTLRDEIRRQGGKLDETKIRRYTWEILHGLEYLHSNGLVHCDIKSSNILMGSKNVKISDLGCATTVGKVTGDGDSGLGKFSGTPVFMAPEVVRGEQQGFEADIWALGCTVIEMATGENPWPEVDDPLSALYRIGFSDDLPKSETEQVKELVASSSSSSSSSPKSVFDHNVWDSFDEENHEISSLSSASERIERLVGGDSVFTISNWSSDQDWITVRSNVVEESDEFCDINDTLEMSFMGVQLEELPSSMFDYVNTSSSSVKVGRKRGFLVAFENVEIDIVPAKVSKRKNEKISPVRYQLELLDASE